MIKIGIENSVHGNDYLYSYDSEIDKMGLGQELSDGIVRFSITCDDLLELKELIPDLVLNLIDLFYVPCRILTGWSMDSPMLTPSRMRFLEGQYVNKGFTIETHGDYRIGLSSPMSEADEFCIQKLIEKTSYLIWSSSNSLLESETNLLTSLVQSCSRSFAAPDLKGENILKENVKAFAYVAYDDSIRPGLVLLTDNEFNPDFLKIFDVENAIIRKGDEADTVWQK